MQADILIVGGGLAGCASAYFLAKEGADVLLIERFDLNTQASGCNAGSIHAQIPHKAFTVNGEAWARNFGPAIPLLMDSIGLWSELGAELGVDLEFATKGGLLVAETEEQFQKIREKALIEREFGLPVEVLGQAELRARAPYISKTMVGGGFCPIEGKANPLLVTPALARAAERLGARLLRRTELFGIECEKDGFLAATSAGPIRAKRVLDCAGADAGRVARMVGVELPIDGHPIQVSVTEPVEPLVDHLVYFAGDRLTLKQTRIGSMLIGGGWPARQDPKTGRLSADPNSLLANLRVARKVVPELASVELLRTWPAIVNGTADWKPIIGEVPRVPGFFLAMFPWLGFTASPIVARLVAQLMLGRKPDRDLTLFSAERYS